MYKTTRLKRMQIRMYFIYLLKSFLELLLLAELLHLNDRDLRRTWGEALIMDEFGTVRYCPGPGTSSFFSSNLLLVT